MNYVLEYWDKIESGEIVTSRRVKAVYGRLVKEMTEPEPASAYYFDEATGERLRTFGSRPALLRTWESAADGTPTPTGERIEAEKE